MALVYKTAGYEVAGGLTKYTTCARKVTNEPQVELKPPIFARLQRVRYEAYLNFQQDEDHWQPLFTSNDLDEQHRSKTQFFTYIKDATACGFPTVSSIQQFVSLFSKSPIITVLEVALTIKPLSAGYQSR